MDLVFVSSISIKRIVVVRSVIIAVLNALVQAVNNVHHAIQLKYFPIFPAVVIKESTILQILALTAHPLVLHVEMLKTAHHA